MDIIYKIKNRFDKKYLSNNNNVTNDKFKRNNHLIINKLIDYIPAMMITNLSTLLLVSVDGIIVGHLIGEEALSSVNVFYPVNLLLSVISAFLSIGISTAISSAMGEHNYDKLMHIKNAGKFLVCITVLIISFLQIPIVYLMLKSYNMEKELFDMTFEYGIGLMILNPFGIISTVCVYALQITGRVKVLMYLSIIESVLNLAFDYLFVGIFKMGTIGAGFGTAVAGVTRAIITIIYIYKSTDLLKTDNSKFYLSDVKCILTNGLPELVYRLMLAFQNYYFMRIVLLAFGTYGGTIKGVCSLCYNITNIFVMGIVSSMRPLVGFFEGAKDVFGLRDVMKIGTKLMIISVSIMTIIICVFPVTFYSIMGVDDFLPEAILSLRYFSLYLILNAIVAIYRIYLTAKKDTKFLSITTIFSYISIPIFAYLFYTLFSPSTIWLSNLVVAIITIIMFVLRRNIFNMNSLFDDLGLDDEIKTDLIKNNIVDYDRMRTLVNERILYMSVKPEDAIEASRFVRKYAMEKNFSERIAYRMSLCMEEMVNYVVASQKKKNVSNQIVIRFKNNSGIFMMLDDGENISLDNNKEYEKITTNNYDLLKKICKSYSYEYILNLNYTIFNF